MIFLKVYCTVCGTHLCEDCSLLTHNTRTLNKHKRIPLSEKPREKPICSYHTSHVMEFTCLEPDCRLQPLMCYICKDYGRHKGHKHNLLELEAEQSRGRMATAVQKMKKFIEEMGVTETAWKRVGLYFQQLRDQQCVQEVATVLLQVAEVCI